MLMNFEDKPGGEKIMSKRVQIYSKSYYEDSVANAVVTRLDQLLESVDPEATIFFGYPLKGDIPGLSNQV